MEAAGAIRMLPAQLRARGFERECERLRPLGIAFILRRYGSSLDRADAEDAVAEVIIRLHRRAAAGQFPDNLRATFFTSARNAAIDQLRSRAAKPTVALEAVAEAPAFNPSPAERAESGEEAVRLQEALARMRPNYREAIVLRFGLGLSVPEIADQLGVSLPAAKKLVLRATAQVRKRLAAIDGAQFCPEMRELARRSLLDKEASGLASPAEERVLRAHFEHCGPCRSFLSELHGHLHELGGAALLGAASGRAGAVEHLTRWLGVASHGVQAGAAKLRLTAFKASGALQPGDAGGAGALAGTGQKIAAICTAGVATTATCLATGIVGPGIGVSSAPPVRSHDPGPAHVRQLRSYRATAAPLPVAPVAAASSVGASSTSSSQGASKGATSKPDAATTKAKPQTAAQQSQEQFGFEGSSSTPPSTSSSSATASSSSAPPAAPEPAPAPAPTPAPSGGGAGSGGGGASGTESFGFQG